MFVLDLFLKWILCFVYDPQPEIIPDDDDEWKLLFSPFCILSLSLSRFSQKHVQHDIDNFSMIVYFTIAIS